MPTCVARDVRRLQAVSALLVGLPQTPQIAFARQQVDELILDLSGECVNVATMAMCYVNMSEVLVSLSQCPLKQYQRSLQRAVVFSALPNKPRESWEEKILTTVKLPRS